MTPTRALIIRQPWIRLILNDGKTWEMRNAPTNVRGRIGLILAGSGKIVGEATLVDSLPPIDGSSFYRNFDKHLIPGHFKPHYEKWVYPWVLEDVQKYDTPITYKHPQALLFG